MTTRRQQSVRQANALQTASSTKTPQAVQQTHHVTAYTGPIPDPSTLQMYSQIDPTFPERIMAAMERQELHRQKCEIYDLEHVHAHNATILDLEHKRLLLDNDKQKRSQIFGLMITFVALLTAGYLALHDHDSVAGIIGGSTAGALGVAFITGKIFNKKSIPPS